MSKTSLTLIGTGHVFRIADAIEGAIVALAPMDVFVELDAGRLHALRARRAGAPPGKGGFVQGRLQRFQEGIAQMYGAQVGEEMLAAVEAARAVGARVHLIDPPAEDTVRRVLRELTWRERARGVGLMVKGLAQWAWPGGRKRSQANVEEELARYQADPDAALADIEKDWPTVYRIVIRERDELMAKRIRAGLRGPGVAVLGDGHVAGIARLLADLEPRLYRLGDVREGHLPGQFVARGTPAAVFFGYDAQA